MQRLGVSARWASAMRVSARCARVMWAGLGYWVVTGCSLLVAGSLAYGRMYALYARLRHHPRHCIARVGTPSRWWPRQFVGCGCCSWRRRTLPAGAADGCGGSKRAGSVGSHRRSRTVGLFVEVGVSVGGRMLRVPRRGRWGRG